MSGCGLGFRDGTVGFLVIFEAVLSSVVRQLSFLRGSLEHVVGPLWAAAATPGSSTSAYGEGASAAGVCAPSTAAPVHPLHLSLTVAVIVLHKDMQRWRALKAQTEIWV